MTLYSWKSKNTGDGLLRPEVKSHAQYLDISEMNQYILAPGGRNKTAVCDAMTCVSRDAQSDDILVLMTLLVMLRGHHARDAYK